MRIFIGDGIIDGKPSLISISAKGKGKPPTKGKPSKKSKSKPDSDPDLSDDIAESWMMQSKSHLRQKLS